MAADPWKVYDIGRLGITNGSIDLDGHVIKCALMTSSYVPNLSGHVTFSALTGEVAAGSGYTAGGVTVTVTVTGIGSNKVRIDSTDPTWAASGGDIVARYALYYDSSIGTNNLLWYSLLNNTPADVTATDGNPFVITNDASGIVEISGGV